MGKRIFIVEDEEKIRLELTTLLKRYGYDPVTTINFENIVDVILKEEPDVILLDINLPYYDGYYICREIRKKSTVPIIVVTSRNSDIDELMSINLGADDFITKPYNTQILLARLDMILRRVNQTIEKDIFVFKDLKYNMSTSEMIYENNKVELTKNESRILNKLIKNKEKIVSRNDLIKDLWDSDEFVDDNTLTVNVNRLRKKMEEIGAVDYLQTKRGQGYILI